MKEIGKSRQYPYYSLEKSINFTKLIYDVGGKGLVPIESIVSHMGLTSSNNRRFSYEKSSARQYGLIISVDKCLQITERARAILFPLKNDDPNHILKLNEAVMNPRVYRELINRYNNKLLPKIEFLRNIFREKGIIESSLEPAINAFLQSISYLGVLSEDNKIVMDDKIFNLFKIKEERQGIKEESKLKEKNEKNKKPFKNNEESTSDFNQEQAYYSLEFPISTGKRVIISIPSESTMEDLNILKSFINVIESNLSKK